jgi:hypothetical protein
MLDLEVPLAVVCHDAGAANIIQAWLRSGTPGPVRVLMAGPAAISWGVGMRGAVSARSVEEALDGAATLLSGTGWATDLEHRARATARRLGVRSVAVLDHWTNYRERFIRADVEVLPDEFWVTDPQALAIAQATFPGATVRMQRNDYLETLVASVAPPPEPDRAELLYLLEPARTDWGRGRPGEFQALEYFVSRIGELGLPRTAAIRLRPHPSDPPGKYRDYAGRHNGFEFILDDSPALATALDRAAWVAGCESYAMVVALHAQRPVICSLPPWAPPCRLPHPDLIHLKSLQGGANAVLHALPAA